MRPPRSAPRKRPKASRTLDTCKPPLGANRNPHPSAADAHEGAAALGSIAASPAERVSPQATSTHAAEETEGVPDAQDLQPPFGSESEPASAAADAYEGATAPASTAAPPADDESPTPPRLAPRKGPKAPRKLKTCKPPLGANRNSQPPRRRLMRGRPPLQARRRSPCGVPSDGRVPRGFRTPIVSGSGPEPRRHRRLRLNPARKSRAPSLLFRIVSRGGRSAVGSLRPLNRRKGPGLRPVPLARRGLLPTKGVVNRTATVARPVQRTVRQCSQRLSLLTRIPLSRNSWSCERCSNRGGRTLGDEVLGPDGLQR